MKRTLKLFLVISIILPMFLVGASGSVSGSPTTFTQTASVAANNRPVSANASYAALKSNLAAIGADAVSKGSGVTGAGQVVGIVDTGVDPFIPGFIHADGTSKIKQWVDLTGEGEGVILGKYKPIGGSLNANGLTINVERLQSRSGTYVVGMLPKVVSQELSAPRDVYFILYDPVTSGAFERVAVDLSGDLIFKDENSLSEYETSKSVLELKVDPEKTISLVASSIERRGEKVTFGFDLHGHGTGMASIISGYSPSQGGVAPDAQLIVAKSIDSTGYGRWENIVRGIEHCLAKGADVVLVGAVSENPVAGPLWTSVEKLAQSKGSHLVVPAGNKGPGAGTLTLASSWPVVTIASGYYPAATFNALFSSKIVDDEFYPYSSCGPGPDDDRGISVAAPAIAPVPEPGYHKNLQFSLMDGTSASAAYTAGSLVLLRQGSMLYGLDPMEGAPLSLLEGAAPIARVLPVEQGYGKINLVRAWYLVVKGISNTKLRLVHKWKGDAAAGGVWIKGKTLGTLPVWIDNLAPAFKHVKLEPTVDWLKSPNLYLDMAPIAQRSTLIYGAADLCPGFYSGEILADDPSTVGVDGRMTISLALPRGFTDEGQVVCPTILEGRDSLARHFLDVPESAQGLSISMDTLGVGARFMLYNPDGLLVEQGWVEEKTVVKIGLPQKGLWQLCFFKDPQDGIGGKTIVAMEAVLEGVCLTDLGAETDSHTFLVKSDQDLPVTLSFIGANPQQEWRERKSTMVQTNQAMILPLIDIDEEVDTICLRFGSKGAGLLRGYLYRFDEASDKWIEVESAVTDDACLGQIYLDNPLIGRYLASIEAYSRDSSVYAEIDCLIIKSKQQLGSVPFVGAGISLLRRGLTSLTMKAARDLNSPGIVVVRSGAKGNILAVVERAGAFQSVLVQLSGSGALRTIRVFKETGLNPVDAYVTIGHAAYQLYKGIVTAPIFELDVKHGMYQISENRGIFRFAI